MTQNENSHLEEKMDLYGDPGIASYDAKVPKFLLLTYLLLPLWGVVTFYYFWNGSLGWFDRGYWHELQVAANTTFPFENVAMVIEKEELQKDKLEAVVPGS